MIAISKLLESHFNIDPRLSKAVDRWQTLQPADLLRAALLPMSEALPAFERCTDSLSIENQAHRQLLPQLHHNLHAKFDKHPLAKQIYVLRAATLVNNKKLFKQMQQTLSLFELHNIPTLLIKGVAVAPLYYPEISCRPIGDYDLLVPENEFTRAANLLKNEGWLSKLSKTSFAPYFHGCFGYAHGLVHPDQEFPIDLHCHISPLACWHGTDIPNWHRGIRMQVGEITTRRLSDTDNLVQVCMHGLAENFYPPVRWASDAYLIISKPDSAVDWELVQEIARENYNAPALFAAFTYLKNVLDVEIPETTLEALANTPTSKTFLRRWSYLLDRPDSRAEVVQNFWCNYQSATYKSNFFNGLKLLPDFVRFYTNSRSLLGAAVVASRKLIDFQPI